MAAELCICCGSEDRVAEPLEVGVDLALIGRELTPESRMTEAGLRLGSIQTELGNARRAEAEYKDEKNSAAALQPYMYLMNSLKLVDTEIIENMKEVREDDEYKTIKSKYDDLYTRTQKVADNLDTRAGKLRGFKSTLKKGGASKIELENVVVFAKNMEFISKTMKQAIPEP